MSKVTVIILRSNIYSIAEGISVSISQHNGGTPSFEQLWASPDEARKLDIYYREAISDLEKHLTDWITSSSGQFNLAHNGTDYSITLSINRYWPKRLEGLLANKIQDYLVHAVTAGWLNDFTGLEIKQDYRAMASQDMADIRTIIYKREYSFGENLRHRDNDIVDCRSDWTDWSGTGIAYRDQMPLAPLPPSPADVSRLDPVGVIVDQQSGRVAHGSGYTPSKVPPPPTAPKAPIAPAPGQDPRIPDNLTHPNYPPVHTDGIGWDDNALYNFEESEHYINDK